MRKTKRIENLKSQKAITLMVLVSTIIVLLILVGVSIATLTGDNGLLTKTNEANENTQIAKEKEILEVATIQAMEKNRYGQITKQELQNQIDKITGEGKTNVSEIREKLEVLFIESQRYYDVDDNGNIGDYKIAVQDKFPGDITRNENGEVLDGSESRPYEINCIEDLVAFSNLSNGSGIYFENGEIKTVTKVDLFTSKYIVLNRTLDFASKNSYVNSERTDFGNINGIEDDGDTLITELTTGTGFKPISYMTYNQSLSGIFDGKNHMINGIYINRYGSAGLFKCWGTVKNLGVSGQITSLGIGENMYDDNPYVGGILGQNGTTINCWNLATIKGEMSAGGIIGYSGKAINCYNLGTVIGYTGAGGILGGHGNAQAWNIVEIYNCYNAGTITATSNSSNIGGIAYIARTIVNCFSEGNTSKIAYSQANGEMINNYLENAGKLYKDGSEYQGDKNQIVNNLNQYIEENKESETYNTSNWKEWTLNANSKVCFKE